MADDPKAQDLDLAALLATVHGKSDHDIRQEQMDAALLAIESTHRKASLAIRHFERTGRTTPEAAVVAALGALADDSHAPPPVAIPPEPAGGAEEKTTAGTLPPADPLAAHSPPPAAAVGATSAGQDSAARTSSGPVQAPVGDGKESIRALEATQTFVARPANVEADKQAKATPSAPRAAAADTIRDPAKLPANIYAGRGADFAQRELTRTKIIRRPKK